MKLIFSLLMLSFPYFSEAEVWEKPAYKADENHLPSSQIFLREAQEERPETEKKKRPKDTGSKDHSEFQIIDDEMKENVEANE